MMLRHPFAPRWKPWISTPVLIAALLAAEDGAVVKIIPATTNRAKDEGGPCRPLGTAYSSLILKNQLRDGVAPIEACAFNTSRHEFLAVDTAALRVWSLKRELKAVMTPKVGGPAIAAFCLERDDIYIVVYRGRKYGKAGANDSTPLPSTPGCIIYDARLCVLNRFCSCESEVVSASFCQATGTLLIAGKDAILRVFSILSGKPPSPPGPRSTSTTAVKNIQVTVRDICRLEGPIKPVPMTLLEIDNHCGLVVGTNGTDAFLWQMPSSQEKNPGTSKHFDETESSPVFDDDDDASGGSQDGSNGYYKYLGSMLDLQSCEITALSLRSPLLATGLANGKIILWRLHLEQARVRRMILSVVDAHGALPVLNLDLILPEGIRQPLTLGGSPSYRLELGDWSILSGGADGTVVHWSILGFSGGQAAGGTKEDVRLHKIGAYEAISSGRLMKKTERIGLVKGSHVHDERHRQEGSTIDRRLSVTHVMVVQLSACPASSSVDAAAGAMSAATGGEHKLIRQEYSGSLLCEHGDRARTPGNSAVCEGKVMCLAVSGGLVSVLEVVEPLCHVGWARALSRRLLDKREILRMARIPCWWGATAQIGGRGVTGKEKLQAKVPDNGGLLVACPANSVTGYLAAEDVDSGTIVGDGNRAGFLVMNESGWLGWYQGCNREFELVSEIELTSPETSNSSLPVRAKPTCFVPCLTISGEDRNNEKREVASEQCASTVFTWKTTPSNSRAKNAVTGQATALEEKIAVGYSDGSIALMSFPLFSPATREGGGQRDPARMTTRRIKRVDLDGGMAFEASITALCALCAPLIVVGDSEGRLALWTTSASSSSTGSSLLWEDKAAHRGPVIAIQRQSLLRPVPFASADLVGASPSRLTPGPREWIVSAGRGGEIRVWNVLSRWQRADAGVTRPVGLEFFATLITNTSISSSLSLLLMGPSVSASDGCGGGRLSDKTKAGHFSGDPVERVTALKKRLRQEQGGQQKRLYCVVGSNKGLVQAWEVDVLGGRAVKKRPIWSQKVHNHAVTILDAFKVDTRGSASHSAKDEQNFPSKATMSGQLHGKEDHNAGYLVLSGSLDRSLCIFRVNSLEGLCILKRLNMGCAPRGLAGAIFVDLQAKVEALGKDGPTKEVGIILTTGDGEITRVGFQHERDTVGQPLALVEAHKGATRGPNRPQRSRKQTAGAHPDDQIPNTTGIPSDGVNAESSDRGIGFTNAGIVEDSSSASIATGRNVLGTIRRHIAKDHDDESNSCLGLGSKDTMDGWGMSICEDDTSVTSLENDLSIASVSEFMAAASRHVRRKQQQQQQQKRQRAPVDVRVSNRTEQAISRRDSQLSRYRREKDERGRDKKRLRVEGNGSLLAAEAETSRQLDSLHDSFVGGVMERGGNRSAKKHGHREAPLSAVDPGRKKDRRVSPRSSEANVEGLCSRMDIGERNDVNQTAWAMVGTEKGFAGDPGRWQQGLGVSLVDGSMGGNNERVVSAKELLNDRRLREIYIARGRHKKSPVLAREVKAIIKEWSPGLVEACSLGDLESTMNGLRGDERVSFEAVCEIAAALTACNTAFRPGSFGRPTVLSRRSTGNGKESRSLNKPCGHSAPVRPPRYRDMVKSKIRLEYNSMGERVVVRTAVEMIDAYATRYGQQSSSNQVLERKQHSVEEATNSTTEEIDSKRPVGGGKQGDVTTLAQRDLFRVSRGLGFGFPDFSSVGSRVRGMLDKDKTDGSGTRPSRESSAACLGDVPAGLRKMWSRQGSCLFRSFSDSRLKHGETSLAEKTAGKENIFSEAECVHIVRDLLNTRASAAVTALVACRRRGRCSPEAHNLVVGDAIRHGVGCHISTRSTSEGPFQSTDTIPMASTSKETARQVDAEIQIVPLDVSAGWMKEPTTSSRGTWNAVQKPTLRFDPSCPAYNLESLGDMIYGQFRRRYGLLSTAEERLAAFIGSVVEHAQSSAMLRLFARIIGVPAENLGERERPWCYQARAEDIHQALENTLAELVYGARDWLNVRGFMTTDGPCVGSTAGGNSAGGSRNASWRRAVVSRTHAAMCATAVLKSGWGSGHKIMGAAELAILDLPTVRTSGKGALRCGLEPWSEFVDGEEFLEALLALVLKAREFSVRAEDGLFGANAVAGHSFLLARARDINENSLPNPVRSSVQGLLEDVPKISAIHRASITETRAVEDLIGQADGITSFENDPRPRSRLKDRAEELGVDGALLRRLQPLLDSFIREDTHRTGTLNAHDFRRVLCEGHAGLWGDLGTTTRARRVIESIDTGSPSEAGGARIIGFAAEYVDPRLTQAEEEAAHLLVRRFTDAYDGQVCYLDVWLTLYYAVFESGQVVPFVDLPFLCETQLRGADSEHWEALLDYLEATGTTYPPLPASSATSHDQNTLHDNVGGPLKSAHLDGGQLWQPATVDERGTPPALTAGIGSVACLANWQSTPTLGVLRTTIEGGATSSYSVEAANAGLVSFSKKTPSTSTLKNAMDWPQAGWGPGSLTVSRPPQIESLPGTVVSPAVVTIAMKAAQGATTGPRAGGMKATLTTVDEARIEPSGDGKMVAPRKEGIEDPPLPTSKESILKDSRREDEEEEERPEVDVGDIEMESMVSHLRKQIGHDDTTRENDVLERDQETSFNMNSDNDRGPREPVDDDSRSLYDNDELLSKSASKLLYNLDCGTLEPPSPEPPSHGPPSLSVATKEDIREYAATYERRARRKRRQKRIITSIYLRCPFLEPVKSKHAYRVPRGGVSAIPVIPFFREPPCTVSSSSPDSEAEEPADHRKEAMLLHLEKGSTRPDLSVGAGTGAKEALPTVATGRGPWVRQHQAIKRMGIEIDTMDLGFNTAEDFILKGTTAGERVVNSKASSGAPRDSRSPPSRSNRCESPGREMMRAPTEQGNVDGPGNAADGTTSKVRRWVDVPCKLDGEARTGKSRESLGKAVRRATIRDRTGVKTSEYDSDDDCGATTFRSRVNGNKIAQKKIIVAMMADQVAKRRASAEVMRKLISDEEQRKQHLKDEEKEAARLAEEKAAKEAEERQRREQEQRRKAEKAAKEAEERRRRGLEERKKALAQKKAELEKTISRLEEKRLMREAEQKLAEQAKREEWERLRKEEEATRPEAERREIEKETRLATEKEERRRLVEEERLRAEEEARERFLLEQEMAKEDKERENMARHDEDIDIALQKNLALLHEAKRREREAEAARKAELLEQATEDTRRKHSCLMMSKADEESRLWNERLLIEEKVFRANQLELERKEKRRRTRVTRDKNGHPIDIRLWGIECTAETDSDGRLVQRETYGNANGYIFDPKEVFQGEGGSIGGRGGGEGDGTTMGSDNHAQCDAATTKENGDADACLDPEAFFDLERRWLQDVLATCSLKDIGRLFQDTHNDSPGDFFPMMLGKRVAWAEYMEMMRTALLKQARATITIPAEMVAVSDTTHAGNDEIYEAVSHGSRALIPNAGSSRRGYNDKREGSSRRGSLRSCSLNIFHDTSVTGGDTNHDHTRTSGVSSTLRSAATTREGISGQHAAPIREEGQSHMISMSTSMSTSTSTVVQEIKIGQQYRCETGAHHDPWNFFRFNFPSTGLVLTVMLEAECGDLALLVARERVPTIEEGGDWENSSVMRTKRVIRIFPQDPRYGPGEYYIGVRSADIPSRFMLRVLSTSAEEEISAHMRVAETIVNSLSIMANMDPHRLLRDFEGARLEAKETLRKRQDASCIIQDRPPSQGSAGIAEMQTCWEKRQQQQQQQEQEVSLSRRATNASQPLQTSAVSSTPWADAPPPKAHAEDLQENDTTSISSPPPPESTAIDEQSLQDAKEIPLPCPLRRREHQLLSPIPVLDDRNLTGLLATTMPTAASASHASGAAADRASNRGSGLTSIPTSSFAGIPDQHRFDRWQQQRRRWRRHRRFTAPLQPNDSCNERKREVGIMGARQRPARTPLSGEATAREGSRRRGSLSEVELAPVRYSIRRLPNTYSACLRRGDHLSTKPSPSITVMGNEANLEKRRTAQLSRDGETPTVETTTHNHSDPTAPGAVTLASGVDWSTDYNASLKGVDPNNDPHADQILTRDGSGSTSLMVGKESVLDSPFDQNRTGRCVPLEGHQGTVSSFSSSPSRQLGSRSSSFLNQALPTSKPVVASRVSTRSSSGSRRRKERASKGVDIVEEEAERSLSKSEPNLFPEILGGLSGRGGSRRGWLASR